MKKWYSLFLFFILGTSCLLAQSNGMKSETAIFAGGCFWCMQPPYDNLKGVISTTVGYTGGHVMNPTYEQVSYESTGHYEAIQVNYDPEVVTYEELLKVFWHNIDPIDGGGQFCDRGSSYRAAIFYQNEAQKTAALQSEAEVQKKFKDSLSVKILEASMFYEAEDYHQDYYKKNPLRYKFYRYSCGRDQRLKEVWGDQQ